MIPRHPFFVGVFALATKETKEEGEREEREREGESRKRRDVRGQHSACLFSLLLLSFLPLFWLHHTHTHTHALPQSSITPSGLFSPCELHGESPGNRFSPRRPDNVVPGDTMIRMADLICALLLAGPPKCHQQHQTKHPVSLPVVSLGKLIL
jgi:hypothetical protein